MWFLYFGLISLVVPAVLVSLFILTIKNSINNEGFELKDYFKLKKDRRVVECVFFTIPFLVPFINLVISVSLIVFIESAINSTCEYVKNEIKNSIIPITTIIHDLREDETIKIDNKEEK